ncbi:MAG: hypothetical protein ABI638_09230 [Ignavibacteriota bacterium]
MRPAQGSAQPLQAGWARRATPQPTQASKAALINLLYRLKEKDFSLLDVQYMTEHLKMFGAVEISLDEYKDEMVEAYQRICEF